jgi:hypothetical protein
MLLTSLFEVISIACIMPYIGLLIGQSNYMHKINQITNGILSKDFIRIISSISFISIILSNFCKILLLKKVIRAFRNQCILGDAHGYWCFYCF